MTNSSGLKRFLFGQPSHPLIMITLLGLALLLGLAVFAAWQLLGDGVWRSEVRIMEAEFRSPDMHRLVLHVASCHGDPEVSFLRETDVDVQVKVVASSTPLQGGFDCQDAVEVQLQKPLGDRIVIDKHTGRSVNVSVVVIDW